ncbi:hypothetical protein IG631_12218 [Alternaria alternata]|nr:hypothetical protein IG631_12218 [Alternaria alternata]
MAAAATCSASIHTSRTGIQHTVCGIACRAAKTPIRVDVEAAVAVIFGKAKTALNTRSTAASSPTSPSLPELHKLTAQNTNWQ